MSSRLNANDQGPVEGGVYRTRLGVLREDDLRVIVVGDLDGDPTFVIDFGDHCLGIMPLKNWRPMFPRIELMGVDDGVSRAEFRGAGLATGYGWVEVYVRNGRIRLDRSKGGGTPCPTTTH